MTSPTAWTLVSNTQAIRDNPLHPPDPCNRADRSAETTRSLDLRFRGLLVRTEGSRVEWPETLRNSSAPMTRYPPVSLGRLTLLVRDYDEALQFYAAAFGARTVFDETSPEGQRYLHVALPGSLRDEDAEGSFPPVVGIWFVRAGAAEEALVGRQTGAEPLAVLYTTDCSAAAERVAAAGGDVRRPPRAENGSTFAHVADLYGNELVIVQLHSLGVEILAPPA